MKAKLGEARKYLQEVVLNYTGGNCLFWPFSRNDSGYGMILLNGKPTRVHRVVCEKFNGPPPSKEHLSAHSCGKGHLGCVSSSHLRWATRSENEKDKLAHGTSSRGAGNPRAKLTYSQVEEIRSSQLKQKALAEIYGVSRTCIGDIKTGKRWWHLGV